MAFFEKPRKARKATLLKDHNACSPKRRLEFITHSFPDPYMQNHSKNTIKSEQKRARMSKNRAPKTPLYDFTSIANATPTPSPLDVAFCCIFPVHMHN